MKLGKIKMSKDDHKNRGKGQSQPFVMSPWSILNKISSEVSIYIMYNVIVLHWT